MPVEMKRNHQKTQSKLEHLWLFKTNPSYCQTFSVVQWLLKTIDGGGVSLAKYLTHLSPIIALNKLRINNNNNNNKKKKKKKKKIFIAPVQ